MPPLDVTKFLFYASWCHPLTSLGTISAHTSSQMLQIYMFKLCVFFVVVCICCACLMRRILVSICCCRWFMSFVVLLLSFLVVICRLWLRLAFFIVYDISGCQHCLFLCALVCVCVLQADSNHISVLDPCHYFCNHFHCCVVCWNCVWMRVSVLQLFFQGSFFFVHLVETLLCTMLATCPGVLRCLWHQCECRLASAKSLG